MPLMAPVQRGHRCFSSSKSANHDHLLRPPRKTTEKFRHRSDQAQCTRANQTARSLKTSYAHEEDSFRYEILPTCSSSLGVQIIVRSAGILPKRSFDAKGSERLAHSRK